MHVELFWSDRLPLLMSFQSACVLQLLHLNILAALLIVALIACTIFTLPSPKKVGVFLPEYVCVCLSVYVCHKKLEVNLVNFLGKGCSQSNKWSDS